MVGNLGLCGGTDLGFREQLGMGFDWPKGFGLLREGSDLCFGIDYRC